MPFLLSSSVTLLCYVHFSSNVLPQRWHSFLIIPYTNFKCDQDAYWSGLYILLNKLILYNKIAKIWIKVYSFFFLLNLANAEVQPMKALKRCSDSVSQDKLQSDSAGDLIKLLHKNIYLQHGKQQYSGNSVQGFIAQKKLHGSFIISIFHTVNESKIQMFSHDYMKRCPPDRHVLKHKKILE